MLPMPTNPFSMRPRPHMNATHQRKMVKPEARPRPGVPEPITRIIRAVFIRRHPRRVADNTLRPRHLSICDLRRARGGWDALTWCWWPGTSAVMNCARLYSRNAGCTPSWRMSSSEMMLRTSVAVCSAGLRRRDQLLGVVPLRTSLISPGGDCNRNFEAA